jgi:hypothetical protein
VSADIADRKKMVRCQFKNSTNQLTGSSFHATHDGASASTNSVRHEEPVRDQKGGGAGEGPKRGLSRLL